MRKTINKNGAQKGHRLTVRLEAGLGRQLASCARRLGKSESDLVRLALAEFLPRQGGDRSFAQRLRDAGILGCSKQATPKDLATNPKHMEGFGRD